MSVAELVNGDTLTEAWLAVLERLQGCGREAFNLVVAVSDPRPEFADTRVVRELNAVLRAEGLQPVDTVANTIFPSALASASSERLRLYDRYRSLVPQLRRYKKNQQGLYFERLIGYPLRPEDGCAVNQLEAIITGIERERLRPNPLRFIYEAQIFAPGKDKRPMGFPCMSSLSFQLDGDRLRLTATYRNQYYIARALGNFIGLAQLQKFVADQTGLAQGPLTIHAFHAQLDPGVRQDTVEELIERCRVGASTSATAVSAKATGGGESMERTSA